MDPFTITTSVLKITATCVSATKGLYELRERFKDADLTIVSICSESTLISVSLSQLQSLLLRKSNLEDLLEARPEVAAALDTALIGCAALFSCLEKETKRMDMTTALAGNSTWKSKAKAVWSKDQLRELLDSLRGQQSAINTITSLLQTDSLDEIKRMLNEQRDTFRKVAGKTQSLREIEPDVLVPRSIYGGDDNRSIYSADPSVMAPSEMEFDFDDQIVSSKVYRRMLAEAMQKKPASDVNDGFSHELTIKNFAIHPEHAEDTARLLGNLKILGASHEPPGEYVELSKTASDPPANIDKAAAYTEALLLRYSDLVHRSTTAGLSQKPVADSYARNQTSIPSSDGHNSPIPDSNTETLTFSESQSQKTTNQTGKQQEPVEHSARSSQASRQDKRTRFGEYILGETIGEGEEAKVKMAWKRDSNVEVAIKLIRRNTLGSHSARLPKIYSQVAILRSLKHPNIVRLHEFFETERHIGIVLEYASGGPLADYVHHCRFLKDGAARRRFAQLVSGVGYLHKKGVVHRNLKLENLLLDRNGNIIIAGFKSAKTFNANDEIIEEIEDTLDDPEFVTRMGLGMVDEDGHRRGDLMQTNCGSSVYAAPEVVAGDALYTGRKVDVWSCGVILYAMLAGHLPWEGFMKDPAYTSVHVLYRHIISTPLSFPEYVTPHARNLLRRMLVPHPRDRADLFEVARHSWLSDYAHVPAFITSATA